MENRNSVYCKETEAMRITLLMAILFIRLDLREKEKEVECFQIAGVSLLSEQEIIVKIFPGV